MLFVKSFSKQLLQALHPELAPLPPWAERAGDFPTPYSYADKTASIVYEILRTVKEAAQPSMGMLAVISKHSTPVLQHTCTD